MTKLRTASWGAAAMAVAAGCAQGQVLDARLRGRDSSSTVGLDASEGPTESDATSSEKGLDGALLAETRAEDSTEATPDGGGDASIDGRQVDAGSDRALAEQSDTGVEREVGGSMDQPLDAAVGLRDGVSSDVSISDAAGEETSVEAGPPRPCTGLCTNPVVFITPYISGSLGVGAACFETVAPLQGFVCGNFVAPRMLAVNGVVVACNGSGRNVGTPRNGGYCFQAPSGTESSEYFNTY